MLDKEEIKKIETFFQIGLILFIVFLTMYIFKPFFVPLFFAGAFVFLLKTPYKKITRKIHNKKISAIFVIFIFLNLILVPTYFIFSTAIKETSSIVYNFNLDLDHLSLDRCEGKFCNNIKKNFNFLNSYIKLIVRNISNYVNQNFSNFFSSLSSFFIKLSVFLLALYFFLVDGDRFIFYIKKIIPMREEYKNVLFIKFKNVSKAVLIDSFLVAIVQGMLLGLGFFFLNIPNPVFWGILASFFALLPIIGTTIIWIPVVIYKLIVGLYFQGIALALYCAIIVGLSDNILRTILLKRKMNIHPFLIFLSVLGGLELFGFFGIFFGPIIISLFITLIQIYHIDLNKW